MIHVREATVLVEVDGFDEMVLRLLPGVRTMVNETAPLRTQILRPPNLPEQCHLQCIGMTTMAFPS